MSEVWEGVEEEGAVREGEGIEKGESVVEGEEMAVEACP